MQPDVTGFLEEFFETGFDWDAAALGQMAGRLEALSPSPVAGLAPTFAGLRDRLLTTEVPEPLRREVEAVVYPRLWKVLEAVKGGLPAGEQRARIESINRRLGRMLAAADAV
ncbi:MAG TPA: hypothetical protein VHL53_14870 [Acidimicrobiia bacterium]|nr:hypothetical protein [Acidimicrobiia bacterium]